MIVGLLLPINVYAEAQPEAQTQAGQTVEFSWRSPWAAIFDVVILRPAGLAVLAVGAALFVPAAILTAPGGTDSLQAATDIFIIEPVQDVFQRRLGDF